MLLLPKVLGSKSLPPSLLGSAYGLCCNLSRYIDYISIFRTIYPLAVRMLFQTYREKLVDAQKANSRELIYN